MALRGWVRQGKDSGMDNGLARRGVATIIQKGEYEEWLKMERQLKPRDLFQR